jgi:branched-chain amino acid transport system ATP-binding protein
MDRPVALDAAAPARVTRRDTAAPLLEVTNLDVVDSKVILVLRGLPLVILKGEIVALLGADGADKPPPLKAISGRLKTEAGQGRRRDGQGDIDVIHDYLLRTRERKRLMGHLSDGEQQMLAIERAQQARLKLMLMRAPSLGLSPLRVKVAFDIIRGLSRDLGITIRPVEQNAGFALSVTCRDHVRQQGEGVPFGTAALLAKNDGVKEFRRCRHRADRKPVRTPNSPKRRKPWL